MAEPQLNLDAPATTANIHNITLRDDISSIHVDDPLLMNEGRDWSDIGSIGGGSINIKDSSDSGMNDSGIFCKNNLDLMDRPALDDGFGGQLGVGIVDEDDVFGMPITQEEFQASQKMEMNNLENGQLNMDKHNLGDNDSRMSPDRVSIASDSMDGYDDPVMSPGSPGMLDDVEPFNANHHDHNNGSLDNHQLMNDANSLTSTNLGQEDVEPSKNTLILEQIDSQLGGQLERKRKRRKKIGMVIDENKTLSGEEMKHQLSDTSDIIANLDLAPPNKMLMNWKKTGLSDKLFSLPERTIAAKALFVYYSRNLITSRFEGINDNEVNDEQLINHDFNEEIGQKLNGSNINDPLADFDDVDQHYQQLQHESQHEFQAPKTPPAHKSPSPLKKKRKTEDKENHEVSKRARDTKYEKLNINNNYDRAGGDSLQFNDSMNLPDINGSIQEARDASEIPDSIELSHMQSNRFVNDTLENKVLEQDPEDDIFDDYGGPMSVGPVCLIRFAFCLSWQFFLFQNEEMLPDETADQFEERIRTKRSNILLKHMGTQLEENGHINFQNMIRTNKRKLVSSASLSVTGFILTFSTWQVAQKFYALLVLKKQMAIELYQNADMPYSELIITKGVKYDEHMMSTVA